MRFLIFLFFINSPYAQDSRFQEEKEQSVIDYSNIRNILKEDGLEKFQKNKVKTIKKMIAAKKEVKRRRSLVPDENKLFTFFSRYWLAKNASLLRWDFSKPSYGIADHFKKFLEKMSIVNKKFSILVVNTPEISHFGLPSNSGEYIFILSLPFMKALDLSKEDISLLLLEDMIRVDRKVFRKAIKFDKDFIGKTFTQKKEIEQFNEKLLSEYDRIIFKRGFNFSEQFKVTKLMDSYLKPSPKLWSNYVKLLNKINKLVKGNYLFKKYLKIYPSPQMQIKWLSPKKEVL